MRPRILQPSLRRYEASSSRDSKLWLWENHHESADYAARYSLLPSFGTSPLMLPEALGVSINDEVETDKSYISHVHVTALPGSSFPLLLVNQNLVVIWGSMKASNTFATGLRMSISTFALGAVV